MAFAIVLRTLAAVSVVRLVNLYRLSRTAHGATAHARHGLAKPVHHEPSGFVSDANRPVDFVGGNAVLARIEHVRGHPPLSQGNLGPLENSADSHGELAFAIVAIEQTGTMRLLLALN